MDIIGYTGMILLIYAFFLKERYKMHLLISIASVFLTIYSVIILSIPFILLNIVLFIINSYRFFEFKKVKV